MALPIFIGDEVSAAGFRLAGIEVVVPQPGEEEAAFRDVRSRTSLVIMTAAFANRFPASLLEKARLAVEPLLLIVDDVRGHKKTPDMGRHLRSALGLEA